MPTADAAVPTPAWIAAQRWFRAKARPVAAVTEVDAIPLTDAVRLAVLEVAYGDDGPDDRYLAPLAGDAEAGYGDGAWRSMVAAMAAGAELHGRRGRLRCEATPALAELLPSPVEAVAVLDERRLGVEQTNTSVVLGERLILKLMRRLEPGTDPDVEVGRFLGEVGFDETPALAGSATYLPADGEPAGAAILQAYVAARGDAWTVLLGQLRDEPDGATRAAGEIGALTRRLHGALASRPDNPDFPARRATGAETAGWRAAGEAQLAAAIAAVRGDERRRLVAVADAVRARFADAFGRATDAAGVSRIHGDYHLGQLLAAASGYLVIDFEGEPARPLAERRAPSSPLRDVAGMLRSLDYAARTAQRAGHAPEAWLPGARAAFLAGYGGIGPSDGALLEAFELEKACYEIRYEANNRPAWLWLPLAAVEGLAAGDAGAPYPPGT
jgi:trehalose synthase-fused probable maltokinase